MEHIGRKYSRGIERVYPKAIIYYNVVLARRKQFQRSRVYSIFHLYVLFYLQINSLDKISTILRWFIIIPFIIAIVLRSTPFLFI